jgi:DNA gyrase subunit A
MQFVKGPDFPTGGILYRYRDEGKDDESVDAIAQGYSVGRARLVVQAKAHFEEMSRGRSRIVITELPYQTNKVALLERIASLVRDGKLEGITDLRDESDRTGMRVSIELTRNVEPKDILADLFKLTPLQQTFGMQMLALVNGEPRMLSLKRMLQLFIEHRREIIRRRSEYDLRRARERAHILEGLLRALDILDEVIATIRRSRTVETARNNLIHDFGFTQIQAQAILDMQLRRLAALERRKLQDEHKEIQKQIAYLEDLLANPAKLLGVIKADLLAIKEKYGDARRTQIVDRTKGTLTSTDLLPDQAAWVSVSAGGELRRHDRTRLSDAVLREIGKGSEVELLPANTRDFLYLFGKDGQCRRVSIHEIPPFGQARRLAELTEFTRRDEVTAAIALPRVEPSAAKGYLFLVTEQGMVKRVMLSDLLSAAASDPLVINVDAKDRLRWVLHTQGGQEVILVSASGQSIRFSEEDVRSMGLAAGGVGGMRLKRGDRVVSAHVVDPGGELVTITELGYAKRTALDQYSSQGRNGGGIVTHKVSSRTGNVVAAYLLPAQGVESLIVLQEKGGVKLVESEAIPQMGRGVMGKQATAAMAGNRVTAVKAAAAALTADDIAAGVVEQTVAPPAPAPVPATDGGDGDPPTAAPKPSSRAKSGAASAKPPASKPAPAAKTRPPARSKRIVETQPELPLKAEAAQPASKSNGADGQGKPPVEVKQPSQPKSRRARSTGDAQAAKPSGKTAEAGGKPAAPSQRTVKAETAAETTAAPPKQRKAEGATGSQTKQPQKPKAPAQRSKATQPSSRARASGEAAAEPAKPAKAAPSEPSKPAKEKPAAPAARAKKPARKSGKLSTVTTVKKPRAKK